MALSIGVTGIQYARAKIELRASSLVLKVLTEVWSDDTYITPNSAPPCATPCPAAGLSR